MQREWGYSFKYLCWHTMSSPISREQSNSPTLWFSSQHHLITDLGSSGHGRHRDATQVVAHRMKTKFGDWRAETEQRSYW
jgi:hypothetical protein